MKAGVIAASLLSLAAAQPHRQHLHLHERDLTVVTVTQEAPDVIVMVDQFGNMIGTKGAQAEATPAPAPAAAAEVHVQAAPAAEATPAAVPVHQSAPVAKGNAGAVGSMSGSLFGSIGGGVHGSAKGSASDSISGDGVGVNYSPYRADGTCKSQQEVSEDFDTMAKNPATSMFTGVRFYGTDCDQAQTIAKAARDHGKTIMAGIYMDSGSITSDAMQAQCQKLHDGLASSSGNPSDAEAVWAGVSAVSVGNEMINANKATPEQMVAAVNLAKGFLVDMGFKQPVVTVDTFNVYTDNADAAQKLCEINDFIPINAHSWFDKDSTPLNAGSWTTTTMKRVADVCNNGKKVVVTEAGYPSAGVSGDFSFGSQLASKISQTIAMTSIRSQCTDNLFMFNAFDDGWKAAGIEQHWGLISSNGF